jgi:hypothetical protein
MKNNSYTIDSKGSDIVGEQWRSFSKCEATLDIGARHANGFSIGNIFGLSPWLDLAEISQYSSIR